MSYALPRFFLSRRVVTGVFASSITAITGCAGAHGAASTPAAVPLPASQSGAAAGGQTAALRVSVAVPRVNLSAKLRQPNYISPNTQSFGVTVVPQGSAPGTPAVFSCRATPCTGTIKNLPVGADVVTVQLFAATNGTGTALATGSTNYTVVAGTQNVVNLTFDGIVASATLSVPALTKGTPAAGQPITVTAFDASGATIVGAQPYSTPLTISLADSHGSMSLTKTTITSPSDSATLTYSGIADSGATLQANSGPTVLASALEIPAGMACGSPGKDGAAGVLAGTVNSYFAGTASAASGATSLAVSGPLANGAATPIAAGDLLLVIQTSGATIQTTVDGNYGGDSATANGYTALNSAGKFEYVRAASAVVAGNVSIAGSGAGGGLLNSYTSGNLAASPAEFQVVRVPQYTTATLSGTLTGGPWQFYTGGGGIIAIDVDGTLTLGGPVIMDGQGFMGGDVSPNWHSPDPITSIVWPSQADNVADQYGEGNMGEGIAGAPQFLRAYTTAGAVGAAYNNGSDFIPGGGAGAGSPGNAGGGGGQNATSDGGGGGGGNGGAGGYGGGFPLPGLNPPNFDGPTQGTGAVALPASVSRVFFGGGGGSGANEGLGVSATGEGGAGGGIIMIRANNVVGAGTLSANGVNGQPDNVKNDAGGGGAGGTIMVTTATGTLAGLTATANGGNGGTHPTGYHQGGGGGGGAVLLSAAASGTSVAGGTTDTTSNNATNGSIGITYPGTTVAPVAIPGVSSGAECH